MKLLEPTNTFFSSFLNVEFSNTSISSWFLLRTWKSWGLETRCFYLLVLKADSLIYKHNIIFFILKKRDFLYTILFFSSLLIRSSMRSLFSPFTNSKLLINKPYIFSISFLKTVKTQCFSSLLKS